jgi:hypothetical protein
MELNLSLDRATFRQLAVLMAMQGLLASGNLLLLNRPKQTAEYAVGFADALLEAMTVEEGK